MAVGFKWTDFYPVSINMSPFWIKFVDFCHFGVVSGGLTLFAEGPGTLREGREGPGTCWMGYGGPMLLPEGPRTVWQCPEGPGTL